MIKDNILLVGCGRMGGALLSGIMPKVFAPEQVVVIEPDAKLTYDINRRYNVKVVGGQEPIPAGFQIHTVIFAIKPQIIGSMLPTFAKLCPPNTLFISIAAGKTIAFFEKKLGPQRPVVRAMPNLPAMVGQGVTVMCRNPAVTRDHQRRVDELFSAVGEVYWVEEESQLDAVTAISGSGPAYVFHFMECLIEAARDLGLPEKLAVALAKSTIRGSGELAKTSEKSAAQLREDVTSAKGTTEAALEVLMGGNALAGLVKKAAQAACKRSKELAE